MVGLRLAALLADVFSHDVQAPAGPPHVERLALEAGHIDGEDELTVTVLFVQFDSSELTT
ncbi:hypothetical protein OB955_18400 [Halobacteria archaeon AArc-m2/3/4]|uniref:Uncharacterized protein n=1 Tax=Natronoglomus mannanivorans TaxID=2979990 RepID=A0AAP2Z0F0_9EURY|nr:hypothetical protein [Halobacteria archaeon AArc-xg1-1]MCU4974693.1 hypothetical protein [Halobacteria archaeon AArc-m2/3/4]